MKVVILAGGRGERLQPLTNKLPKPMIEVAGKPILEHIINLFKKNNIREFIITLCYLPDKINSYFKDGSSFGVKINYVIEDKNKPLGTAGGVGLAKKFIKDTFVVTSGDILRELDIKTMINYHKKKKTFATLNVYKRFGPNPKSMVIFDKNRKIIRFIERPKLHDKNFVWANGSFYIFEPEIFNFIPENKPSDFGKDIFPKLLASNKSIFAFPTNDYFTDLGNLEKLERARKTFPRLNVQTF